MASTHEILGRQEVDDLEAILAVTNTDVDEVEHLVQSNGDAIFTWDYDRTRPALGKLYEKAKTSQWNASTDLDWSVDVDPEKVAEVLRQKPEMVHVILTGRNAHPILVELADTVTEMREVKHAYEKGILAQRGIEF